MKNPMLFYHQHLYWTSDLVEGRLVLVDGESSKVEDTFIATSGLANNQRYDCLSFAGHGPIPPPGMVSINHYWVETAPIYMPQVKGVQGNFYKILPYTVKVEKITRGDFGVHFDANTPGSAGCIVLRTKVGWQAFEEVFKNFAKQGIKEVPLAVSYSR